MHRFLLRVAFGCLVLLLAASCGDDDTTGTSTLQLGDADAGRTVTVAKNAAVVIALTSNPSTGFGWSVRDPAPAQLRSEGEPKFVAATAASPVVGAAGTQVFTFRAVEQGSVNLTLDYARPFEKGVPPNKSWSVTIVVK